MVCIKHGLNRPNKIQKAFGCDILTIYTDYAGEDVWQWAMDMLNGYVCDLASFRQYGYYSLVQKSSVFLWVWIWCQDVVAKCLLDFAGPVQATFYAHRPVIFTAKI